MAYLTYWVLDYRVLQLWPLKLLPRMLLVPARLQQVPARMQLWPSEDSPAQVEAVKQLLWSAKGQPLPNHEHEEAEPMQSKL